jgi:hypothetical protein
MLKNKCRNSKQKIIKEGIRILKVINKKPSINERGNQGSGASATNEHKIKVTQLRVNRAGRLVK